MPRFRPQRRPDSWAGIERSLHHLSDDELMDRYRSVDGVFEGQDDPSMRAARLDQLAAEALRRNPLSTVFWYDRGLYAKWRRDWTASRDYNQRALELIPADRREGEAAAWNLGIAATALRDWSTARTAWATFGIGLPEDDQPDPQEPIEADFGTAPVRLNPHPRFIGEGPLTIDGRPWQPEVVWGRRVCLARIRILSVPTPDSGHRFGDVVLHDGDPVGTRRSGEREVGVFNEIALWQRSPLPTLTAIAQAPDAAAVQELADLADAAGGAVEDWTASVRTICRQCSEGSQDADHRHPDPDPDGWVSERNLGLAGQPDVVRSVIERWIAAAPGRSCAEPTVALR